MSFFSSCSFASVSGRDILCGVEQDAELVLVFLQILEPVVQSQVLEMVLEFPADQQRFLQFLVLSGVAEVEFQFIRFWVLVGQRLEVANLFLQSFNFGDGAVHRDFKRLDGTFQALEEVHLHHADKERFAVGLSEGVVSRGLVLPS